MARIELTDKEREKYATLKRYLLASESDLNMMLGMIESLHKDVGSLRSLRPDTRELCLSIGDMVTRLGMIVNLRLTALQDLLFTLREHGISL